MQIEKLIRTMKKLIINDYRVLNAIERAMAVHEYVPIETITNYCHLNINEVNFRLSHIHKIELIKRWTGHYIGYYLTTAGYDCLALHALVEANKLDLFGKSIGVGKESDVFDAITPEGQNVAVKIHRLGRISFRQTKRKRSYSDKRKHISWLYQSRIAAKKEFDALRTLSNAHISVPQPVAYNRHIVVMERIIGTPLYLIKELPNKDLILNNILDNIYSAFTNAGLIHGDLSEYNIIITPDWEIMIIDWPQWVPSDHPNFKFYIKRDISNILKFFQRKYDLFRDEREILKEFF
ncbi:MAG: RIO1 family regulatory kinase/ATPase domain-containing protein [Candidatus Helarchaeota archaeon]